MFTPIGFFAPQVTGWDPSLGGTLSVLYHWDFTDSSTMSLTGTDMNSINDKISSYTLSTYSAAKPQLNSGYVQFGGGSATSIRSGTNIIPTGMFNNNTFTICVFSERIAGTSDSSLWALASDQANAWRGATEGGYRSSMPGIWDPQLCDSHGAVGTNVYMRWFGSSNQSRYSTLTTAQSRAKSLVGFAYNGTNQDTHLLYDNGTQLTYCNRTLVRSTEAGEGFHNYVETDTINYYHTVVYSQILSSTNMSDVFDSFAAS